MIPHPPRRKRAISRGRMWPSSTTPYSASGFHTGCVVSWTALELARLGRDRRANLADELGRALVEANHWPIRIGRLGIEIEHVLHPGNVFSVDLWNAPHVLAPRLQIVFGQAPAHGFPRDA